MKIILLISKNREITDSITKYKPQNIDLVVIKNEQYLRYYLEEYLPDFVIIDVDLENNEVLDEYSNKNPNANIIFNNKNLKKYNFTIPKYINLNIQSENNIFEIINIISKIEKEAIPKNNYKVINQQIISIYSLKGGTGKTTIAFNIAYYLKKLLNTKILLIDLNFSNTFSDLTLFLNTNQIPNLNYYIENYKDGESALQKSLLINNPTDFDILLPPLSIDSFNKFNLTLLNSLIDLVKTYYNFIIIDLPNNSSDLINEVINLSNLLFIISLPDKNNALKLARYKFKDEHLKIQNKINIINNPYNNLPIKKSEFEKISNHLISFEIPYYKDVNKRFFNFFNIQTAILDMEYEATNLLNKHILK